MPGKKWNDPNLPWRNPNLPWNRREMPWNDQGLPWKTAIGGQINISGLSLPEDTSVGGTGLILSISNKPDDWGTTTWAITFDPDDKFDIDPGPSDTAELEIDNELDFETKTSHSFTVTATPSGPYDPAEGTFEVQVTDVDDTAPILSATDINSITETTATALVTTNEGNGTLYLVVTTSATDPSKAQVKAGQDHSGGAAVFADDQAIATAGSKNFSVTGLTGATTYYAYFMHEDAAGNQSDVVSFDAWDTSAPDAPGAGVLAHDSNGGGRTPVFTVSGLAAAGAAEGDTVRIYTLVDPDGVSFTEYVSDTISAGDIVADEITISGVTLLNDALYQAHARIENGEGLGDLSNEVEFAINTALTLTALFGPEIDYNTNLPFLIEGDLQDDDRIIIEADQDSAFGSVDDTASLIYSGGNFVADDPANPLGPLANGLTYFRCYRERVGADDADYSNTQSTTINVAAAITQATRLGPGGYPIAA